MFVTARLTRLNLSSESGIYGKELKPILFLGGCSLVDVIKQVDLSQSGLLPLLPYCMS